MFRGFNNQTVPFLQALGDGNMKTLKPGSVISRAGASIYVVDEGEGLAGLYTLFLKETGYPVRAYDHRADALTALTAEKTTPALLIMDYLAESMPVERFLQRCRLVHPSLRFLMASELSERDVRSSGVISDGFIQKPFTADEFVQEVRAALQYADVAGDPPFAREIKSTQEKPTTLMFNKQKLSKLKKMTNPEVLKSSPVFDKAAVADGSIPVKFKELIAVAVAFATQCPYCIDVHSGNARKAGATDAEMIEAAMIAAALQAGAAVTHPTHALSG